MLESVKEELLQCIRLWMSNTDNDIDILESAYEKVESGTMLSKAEAKCIAHKLEINVKDMLDNWRMVNTNPILAAGDMEIYYQIWHTYCRPGTYHI